MVKVIHRDPLLDSLREDKEFENILKNIEGKYNTEHNRVKEWLAKNEDL